MQRNMRYGILAVIVLMVVLLSGCMHVRQEVTLKAGENWDVLMKITFPKSTVEQVGAEQMTSSQAEFEQQKTDAAAKGIKADFKVRTESNGDVVWEITYSGQGLELLNTTLFSNTVVFSAGEGGRIKFNYDAGDVTSLTSMGGSYTFVLNAGTVYSNNATEAKGSTLTWKDPTGPMAAEVSVGGGGSSVGLIIGLVLGGIVLLVIVAVVLLYLRGKQLKSPAPAPAAPPPAPPAPPA